MLALDGAGTRVWLEDLPPLRFEGSEVLSDSFDAVAHAGGGVRCAAVEKRLNLCSGWYGVLGGEFVPDDSSRLWVEVPVRGDLGTFRSWEPWSLPLPHLAGGDDVRIGLTEEDVVAVLGAVRASEDRQRLGGGPLRFDCAGYGWINSRPGVFGALAEIVLRLLGVDPATATRDEILASVRVQVT